MDALLASLILVNVAMIAEGKNCVIKV